MRRSVSALAMLAAAVAGGCRVFEALEDCENDSDCDADQWCNREGQFCEKDTRSVRFGVLIPLEGADGASAPGYEQALDLAAHIVNDQGGVLGRPIEFVVREDRPLEVMEPNLDSLLDDERIAGLIAGTYSDGALRVQEVVAERHVIAVSPSATAPALSTNEPAVDRYFFRTMTTSRRGEALGMGLYAGSAGTKGRICDRLSLLHADSTYAMAYAAASREIFGKLGVCLVTEATFPTTVITSYLDPLEKMIAARPDCTLIAAPVSVTLELLRQAKPLLAKVADGWSGPQWLASSSMGNPSFLSQGRESPDDPSSHIAKGMLISDADTMPPTSDYAHFRQAYDLYFGLPALQEPPHANVPTTFDAAILLALAVERAGSTQSRPAIRDAFWDVVGTGPDHEAYGPDEIGQALSTLRRRRGVETCGEGAFNTACEIHYRGASGPLVFDPQGTVSLGSIVWRIDEAGELQVVRRFSVEEHEAFEGQPALEASCL